jgi:hypothetical protein
MFRNIRVLAMTMVLIATGLVTAVQPVAAGCGINIKYVNNRNNQITVDLVKSKVRIRLTTWPTTTYGTWARYDKNNSFLNIPANKTVQKAHTLTFSCTKKRQFKFYIDKGSSNVWIYKPSTTGVTTANTITVTIN